MTSWYDRYDGLPQFAPGLMQRFLSPDSQNLEDAENGRQTPAFKAEEEKKKKRKKKKGHRSSRHQHGASDRDDDDRRFVVSITSMMKILIILILSMMMMGILFFNLPNVKHVTFQSGEDLFRFS